MLSKGEFVRQSLELNLFFLRIMKEHAIFIEGGFTPKNRDLSAQADQFKNELTALLQETVNLSHGKISPEAALSGEFVTDFTLNAEKMTEFFTGIQIDTSVTMDELELRGEQSVNQENVTAAVVERLNTRIINTVQRLADFKETAYQDVLSCRLYTHNYVSMIEHIREEALYYLNHLERLQNRRENDTIRSAAETEHFWNHIIEEHAQFIRGMLDPSEEHLIDIANMFAQEFERLTALAANALRNPALLPRVTKESREETIEIRNFKAQGTKGILECQIKSIILPLLGDHVLREANHYLRLLKQV